MPGHAPPATHARDLLAGYLRQQQDAFRMTAFGLTDEQAARTPTPSALSIGVLVQHVTACQRSWLDKALAAPDEPVDERTRDQAMADWQDEFTFTANDSLDEALAAWDACCDDTLDAVQSLDVATPVPVPRSVPWFPNDVEHWSVHWVWMHLVEELARHAGHADIIREAIDGATMYELMAGYEGWPETDWLTPWQPPD